MKIVCDNCNTRHELDPPAWVVSSGRPFRFRCPACGNSQSVVPQVAVAKPPETPAVAPRAVPSVPPPALVEREEGADGPVYLKQSGQIYSVRDWSTLKRWITERRVDRNDLVSEGGVRWEPIGSHAELSGLFALSGSLTLSGSAPDVGLVAMTTPPGALSRAAGTPSSAPIAGMALGSPQLGAVAERLAPGGGDQRRMFPFADDTPFGAPTAAEVWSDDDTDGVPSGLPPLPTEDEAEHASLATAATTRAPVRPPADSDDLVELSYDPTESEEPPDSEEVEGAVFGFDIEATQLVSPEHRVLVSGVVVEDDLSATEPPAPVKVAAPEKAAAPRSPPPLVRAEVISEESGVRTAEIGRAEILAPVLPSDAETIEMAIPDRAAFKGGDEFPFDTEWDESGFRTPRRWLFAAAAVLTVSVGLALFVLVLPQLSRLSTTAPEVVDPDVLPRVAPAPAAVTAPEPPPVAKGLRPRGEQVPLEAEAAVPTPVEPAPVEPVQPAPAPRPKPAAEAKPPSSSSQVKTLVSQGWKLADDKPDQALGLFRQALDLEPENDEANYGYGYLLLMEGRSADATGHLCRAKDASDREVRQDVTGLIATHGLTCK